MLESFLFSFPPYRDNLYHSSNFFTKKKKIFQMTHRDDSKNSLFILHLYPKVSLRLCGVTRARPIYLVSKRNPRKNASIVLFFPVE